jgi:predicted alpha-1,2-mannosidase
MRFFYLLLFLSLSHGCSERTTEDAFDYGLAKYVDPLIGTADHGHVYPGATVPFGAVQLSPDNGTQGWDWCSGYNYADSTIVGFSHTHLSGTGIGDLCDILLMPATGNIDLTKEVADVREEDFATTFNHENEVAKAGFYQVLMENGIEAQLTVTEHAGLHKYIFPEKVDQEVILDLGYHINWDSPTQTDLSQAAENIFVGKRFSTGWAKNQHLYFALVFSRPPQLYQVYDSTTLKANLPAEGRKIRAKFRFQPDGPLMVKVGVSSASTDGAIDALKEIPDWDFEAVKDRAARTWIQELSKIQVTTDDEALLRTFYTALCHTYLAPVIYADVLGQYKAADSTVVTAQGYTRYDIFSLWDTFRAAHPLLTITQSDRVNDFVRSLLAHYDEYGLLPVWSLLGNETNTMTGYHAIPVITDAILKGHHDFDIDKAFLAMKASAMQNVRGTDLYRKYDYIPYELMGQSVTRTIEYAYDDWCIAQIALTLGKKDDYEYFTKRAGNYKNLFDPSTGFMRAKLTNGNWKTPFDPLVSDHNFEVAEYTEGNAWQHAWFVPHDIKGLIDLHGGNEAFVHKLDTLFSMSSEVKGENVSADISGLIGQYAHGNEPSHHIPYLYNYAGASWKSQEIVRQIMETQYNDTPAGLCGNEDCGQMSAWFVFSAMGFYPVNPAEGVYVIGTPLFTKVVIDIGEGRSFTIRTRHLTKENKYIQAATLHDEPLTRSYIRHYEIMDGGELILEMGPQPNYLHWSDPDASPPSASDLDFE